MIGACPLIAEANLNTSPPSPDTHTSSDHAAFLTRRPGEPLPAPTLLLLSLALASSERTITKMGDGVLRVSQEMDR